MSSYRDFKVLHIGYVDIAVAGASVLRVRATRRPLKIGGGEPSPLATDATLGFAQKPLKIWGYPNYPSSRMHSVCS